MKYIEFKVGNEEYKLRLGANEIVNCEKKLGGNLLDIFMGIDNGKLPELGQLLIILHASMQKLNHGITMDKVYDIFDLFAEEGKDITDLIPILMDVMSSSGFFKKVEKLTPQK